MTQPRDAKRKLIEVGLPLEEINAACKADKERKTGTLRNIHKWFAPMPLPAWRALLFAALVDDPGDEDRRLYYLDVIRRLVKNGADVPDEGDLREAQLILRGQFPEGVPTVMDPFCGGGSTLVEGQRLGLPTYGSDLNPVPVLISRVLTEILPKVWGAQPIHSELSGATRGKLSAGEGMQKSQPLLHVAGETRIYVGYGGFIRDATVYAEKIRDAVAVRLARHFPKTEGEVPIAWLWARTAPCPNPACRAETILSTSFWLSKRKGDLAWITPVVNGQTISLEVTSNAPTGEVPAPPKIGKGDFSCLCCATTVKAEYLRQQGKAGSLGLRMAAIAVEKDGRRVNRAPRAEEVSAALECERPEGVATHQITGWSKYMAAPLYGLDTWADIYTNRQLAVLAAFADEIAITYKAIITDGGSIEWAEALTSFLALGLGKLAQGSSSQSRLKFDSRSGGSKAEAAFGRNDLPMTWDFCEIAPFDAAAGAWLTCVATSASALRVLQPFAEGAVVRSDARTTGTADALVATDPPYFDAIGYADLSDYFYVWHRKVLVDLFSDLYTSIATPKRGELTAIPAHHDGSTGAAKSYFINGFNQAFENLQKSMRPGLPCVVVYASKEQKDAGSEQTRWSSILTSMIDSGLEITGTWPIHGSDQNKLIGQGTNSVATYIAMVARPRPPESQPASWSDFARQLRAELPGAIRDLQVSAVLPVDVPQAVLGPGMRIFSRHPAVLRGDGSSVSVDDAIAEINHVREEIMEAAEGDLDRDSQCALAFWSRHGWADATFDDANNAVRSRGRSVEDLLRAEVLSAEQNRARVLGAPGSLDPSWDPTVDPIPTAWEGVHHVAERLTASGLGVPGTAVLYSQLQRSGIADATRALAYRLASLSAKLGRTADEQRYNDVIEAWPLLATASIEPTTDGLF